MKTAISLPNEIFKQADRLAHRLKMSRSALYREAVVEYVAQHEPDAVTDAMNRVADQMDTCPDAWLRAAARRALRRTEW